MKQLFLLGMPLLLVSACAQESPPTPTTTAFDGLYGHGAVTAMNPPECRKIPLPPNLTIKGGSALFQVDNLIFQGPVTPQGALVMNTASGQTLRGQIDSHFVLTAHVAGPNCAYDMTWSRVS
jgi:hypothetical protein